VHEGVRVRWRRFGTDTTQPPLVLLHGGHGSWMHWLRNAEALSAGRTLWLPDMPGFNDSDAPPRVAPGEDSLPPCSTRWAARSTSSSARARPSTWAASLSAA
jgi:pimeloyl-ACP methyl ester carboxylesterase